MDRIWAVAKNAIRQALRMKVAAIFVVLLLVLLPVMGLTATGDGTLLGRLQTFVSYGMSLTSLLLCLLTIIVAGASHAGTTPRVLRRPRVGFRPTMLFNAAGTRPEPAVSVPSEKLTCPNATARAEPALEPPEI